MKHALILGVGGQDGSYLCEHLLSLGYRVTGAHRRSSVDNLWRIQNCTNNEALNLLEFDLTDSESIRRLFSFCRYDEVYNLADQDVVSSSRYAPIYSADVTYGGTARLLETLHSIDVDKDVKIFQPSSATIFGDQHTHPCDESAQFNPQSPYACAKLGALYLARYYRSRGLRVWCGILYGHASIRQKPEYLVHRIAKQAVEFADGKRPFSPFKDPSFKVDVGSAQDFVRGYHAMLQTETPDDYVLSTGRGVSVEKLIEHAFYEVGAKTSVGLTKKSTNRCVVGDCSKAEAAFDWSPCCDAMDVIGELVDFYSQEGK